MSNLSQSWTFSGKVNYKLVKPVKGSNLKIDDFSVLILKDPQGEENQDIATFVKEEIAGTYSIVLDSKRNLVKIIFSNIEDAWRFKMRYGDFLVA